MNDLIAHMNVRSFGKGQTQYLYDILRGRGGTGLSNVEALTIYGIGSLSRRICDLKEKGVAIEKKPERNDSRTIRYFFKEAA